MKTSSSKRMLILIKSVEESGWQDQAGITATNIPPLGTLNEEGKLTSENDKTDTGSYLRNQALMGGFEPLLGKTSLSLNEDPDKQDIQDISFPKMFARGHDSYAGSLEFTKTRGTGERIIGAIDGFFDSIACSYKPHMDFREFELWVFENPNIIGLDVTSADLLIKNYYCILDKTDLQFSTPMTYSVPVSRTYYERFPMWTVPATSQGNIPVTPLPIMTGTLGSLGIDNQPREHTRVSTTITQVAPAVAFNLVITGRNVFELPVTETILFPALVSPTTKISKKYFRSISNVAVSIITTAPVSSSVITMDDYDWKPQ